MWDAHVQLKKLEVTEKHSAQDTALEKQCVDILNALDADMNDDLNTAKVLAGLFELVPVINSIKDGHVAKTALSSETLQLMKQKFQIYLEDIFGLKEERKQDNQHLGAVLQLIAEIRKDARSKKDYATSDKIRNQLLQAGIQLKDEKDGGVSWEVV
ncbi:MAG: hypothetical protein RL131_570, partial [Bacteroidota bacterium]